MINIDQYAYSSKLKGINPAEKILFALLTLCVCLWANSVFLSIIVLGIMTWISVAKGGTPFSFFLKLMLIPLFFLSVGVLSIALEITSYPHDFIIAIPVLGMFVGLSKTGTIIAIKLFFKALGGVSCLYFLSLNTPMIDIQQTLKRLKCPALLLELMSLVYRFIFVLIETANTIYTSQDSRLGYSGLSSGYRSMGALVSALFIRSYKRSDELFTALEARGYDGELNVLADQFRYSRRSYLKAVGMNVFFVSFVLFARYKLGGLF